MNATQTLGKFLGELSAADMSPAIREKAIGCLIDTIGVAMVAREEKTARAMATIASPPGDPALAARLWIDSRPASLSDAVLANTVLAHAHFHDDSCHSSWTHPGSLIVPIAVALGEARDASLADVIRSLVAGYVTLAWLGADEEVAHPLIKRGFRGSPVFGTIGAAAAACVALGLSCDASTHAVAIATVMTGGILEPVRAGSDEWRLQNGHAAQGGLLAARAAATGVSGAPNALEGERGFLRAFTGLTSVSAWSKPPSVDVVRHAMAKPYATLGDNMAAVLAAKVAYDQGVDTSRVRAIRITMWRPYTEYPGVTFKGPFTTIIQALASAAYSVSAMLVKGELGYDIPDRYRHDSEILRLASFVTILPDDVGIYLDAKVEVEFDDGSIVQGEAKQSPRTRIFQDRETVTSVFEQRLRSSDLSTRGRMISDTIFDSDMNTPIRSILNSLLAF